VQGERQRQEKDILLFDESVTLSIRKDVEPFKAVVGLLKL